MTCLLPTWPLRSRYVDPDFSLLMSLQKLNSALMSYDLAKRTLGEPAKERHAKLLDAARSHGLSVV
jgi:hypothetical protein